MQIIQKLLFILVILLFGLSNYFVCDYIIYKRFHREQSFLQLSSFGQWIFLATQGLFGMSMLNYLIGSLSDPGYVKNIYKVPAEKIYPKNKVRYCEKCPSKQFKPPRAHHCRQCKKCIYRMDHHCEWFNNCVGIRNQKFFVLFLLYTFEYCSLVIILISGNTALVYFNLKDYSQVLLYIFSFGWKEVIAFIFAVFAVFFIIMTAEFIKDQFDSICENQTTVEQIKSQNDYKHKKIDDIDSSDEEDGDFYSSSSQIKGLFGRPQNFLQNLKAVFGTNIWAWLIPIKPKQQVCILELLYTQEQIESSNQKYIEEYFQSDERYKPYLLK